MNYPGMRKGIVVNLCITIINLSQKLCKEINENNVLCPPGNPSVLLSYAALFGIKLNNFHGEFLKLFLNNALNYLIILCAMIMCNFFIKCV